MKELSLNILDIAENSFKAAAKLVEVIIRETDETLTVTVKDDGKGMSPQTAAAVTDPFFTTRTTRKVGMGIPLFKMEAEQTGGRFSLVSRSIEEYPEDHGTEVTALFYKNHLDFTPLGDIVSTVKTIVQGHPEVDFSFRHDMPKGSVEMDTRELKEVLGTVPLNNTEVLCWIGEYLTEQYSAVGHS